MTGTVDQMADPLWRVRHIYTIRNEAGVPEAFRPNEEQEEILEEVYVNGVSILIIIKARQLGMSTLIAIIILDSILFGTSIECNLTDFNSVNAKKKLREKIFYGFDHLSPDLKAQFFVYARSTQQGEFRVGPLALMGGEQESETKPYSTFIAGETPRGGTIQIAWYSEWWEVAARFPQRSEDILTAGWPAGEQGLRIVETTVHGGCRGEVWNITKQGLDFHGNPLPKHLRSPKTPVVKFFPWWKKASYREQGSPSLIRPDTHRYFEALSKELPNVQFDDAQKLWYQIQSDSYGVFVLGQYPSTIKECWQAPVKGAIWAEALARAKADGRICEVPHDATLETDSVWDLGARENTATLYVQHVHNRRRFIDCDSSLNLDLPDRIRHMAAKGYRFGTHYLPHDGAAQQKNGISFQSEFEDELKRQGVGGRVVVLPRCSSEWLGINHFNNLLGTVVEVDEKKCAKWIEAASLFRRKPDPTNPEVFLNAVVDDWTNHLADCSRYLSEAAMHGHLPHTSNGIMSNLFYDSERIKSAIAALSEHRAQRWSLDHQGTSMRYLSARHDEQGGWLRVWQAPIFGIRYVVAVVNGAMGVWKAAGWDAVQAKEVPASMVAACVDEQGINRDRILEWAALASAHYGFCPVAADVESLPGAIERLKQHGASTLARRQSDSDRRVGQGEPIRKPGFEMKKEERLQSYSILQECWRGGMAEIWCPTTLRQMQGITNGEDQTPTLLSGFSEHWVMMCALALWQIGQATPMRPERAVAPTTMNRAGGYSGLQIPPVRRKLG